MPWTGRWPATPVFLSASFPMQVPPCLKVYPLEAAKALVEWTAACTEVFPPLKTTASGIFWLIEYLEAVKAIQKEYLELERLIREFLEILIAAGRQHKGGFRPIRGLDENLPIPTSNDYSDDESSVVSLDMKRGHNTAPIRLSAAVKSAIRDIDRILGEIKKIFEPKKNGQGKVTPKRSFWVRLFTKDRDRAKLKSLDKRLRDAIEMFKVRAHIKHERALRQSAKTMKDVIAQLKLHIRNPDANTNPAPLPIALPPKSASPSPPLPVQLQKMNSEVVVERVVMPDQRIPVVDAPIIITQDRKIESEIKPLLQLLREEMEAREARNQAILSRLDALENRIANGEAMRKEDLEAWKRDVRFMHDEHHAWERRRKAELQKLPQQIANHLIDAFSSRSTAAIEEADDIASDNEIGAIGSPEIAASALSETVPSAPSSPPSWRFHAAESR